MYVSDIIATSNSISVSLPSKPRVFRLLGRWRVSCPGMCPVALGFDRWDDAVVEAMKHIGHTYAQPVWPSPSDWGHPPYAPPQQPYYIDPIVNPPWAPRIWCDSNT